MKFEHMTLTMTMTLQRLFEGLIGFDEKHFVVLYP